MEAFHYVSELYLGRWRQIILVLRPPFRAMEWTANSANLSVVVPTCVKKSRLVVVALGGPEGFVPEENGSNVNVVRVLNRN